MAHEWNSDNFHAYLLTSEGLTLKPVISKIGVVHGGVKGNAVGCMKVSPNGQKIAAAIKKLDCVELLDFDALTGKITNPVFFDLGEKSFVYGVEFSSDNTKLYVTSGTRQQLYQIDIGTGTPAKMQKSLQLIATNETWCGSLQLVPDGKIYVALDASDYLGVIQQPNQLGKKCNYKEHGLLLGNGRYSKLNLPSFIQTYFDDRENLAKIQTEELFRAKIGSSFYKNILFEFNKYNILFEHFKDLDDLVAYLKLSGQVKVEIIGHTDNDGTFQKNLLLSQNRAKSVAKYLMDKGIDKKRIKTKGFGQAKPIASNATAEGKVLNRRIEFMLKR